MRQADGNCSESQNDSDRKTDGHEVELWRYAAEYAKGDVGDEKRDGHRQGQENPGREYDGSSVGNIEPASRCDARGAYG